MQPKIPAKTDIIALALTQIRPTVSIRFFFLQLFSFLGWRVCLFLHSNWKSKILRKMGHLIKNVLHRQYKIKKLEMFYFFFDQHVTSEHDNLVFNNPLKKAHSKLALFFHNLAGPKNGQISQFRLCVTFQKIVFFGFWLQFSYLF